MSPYQVMAGSVISASLITGLNSDLPGQVIAQVTEALYDSVTGQYLLIPQGSRVIGTYESVVAFGQERALLVWQRIIMPDGSSVVIENLPATDASGYSGLEDKVDFHTWRLLKGIALSTLLGVSTELTFGGNENDLLEAIRGSAQDSANQVGQRLIERELSVQPTITVRPGWPLRIIVNKDLVLRPLSRMTLKLGKLPNRTTAKITFAADANLIAALKDYAEIYCQTYGEKEDISALIPFMLNVLYGRRS